MGQIKFMASIIMTLLFIVAIMSYATNFGNDNNVAIDLNDDDVIMKAKGNLQSDIQTFKSQTNSSLEALYESTIEGGDETTVTGGQFKGGISGAFDSLKITIRLIYQKIFGSEQGDNGFGIILTGLISFLGLVSLLYLWKTWAGKSPD